MHSIVDAKTVQLQNFRAKIIGLSRLRGECAQCRKVDAVLSLQVDAKMMLPGSISALM
jgi:hypothetical protein